jgi:hypothetical protein
MLPKTRLALALVAVLALLAAGTLPAADKSLDSLKKGMPDLKQAGALAFGPEGILFVGDTQGAAIFAIDTGDRPAKPEGGALKIEGFSTKAASLLGTDASALRFNDLAVNPLSGNAYVSVSRGTGPDAKAVLLKITRPGKIEEMSLKDVPFAKVMLPNAPSGDAKGKGTSPRAQSITGLGYVNGQVIVAGLSTEEWSSTLRVIPFPFTEANRGAGVQIFHGAHGRFETNAPVRTFAPFKIKGEDHVLAAYTCTPLVKFPVKDLKPGTKVKGTTIAELGNRNSPLDMVVYQKDGKDYILLTNSSRGVMKITTEGIDKVDGITTPIGGGGTAGLTYSRLDESNADWKNIEQMSRLDKDNVLLLRRVEKDLMLETRALP